MEKTAVQKLAGALKVLVTITLVCNLVALLLVPGMSLMKGPEELLALTPYENPLEVPLRVGIAFVLSWGWVWTAGVYEVVLALFLLFCGICTAVILWQGRHPDGRPFPGGERRQPPAGGSVLLFDRRRRAGTGGVGAVLLRFRRAPADL